MIHSRRRAHLRIIIALAIGIPTLLASALLLRPQVPPISAGHLRLATPSGFAPGSAGEWRSVEPVSGGIALEVQRPSDSAAVAVRPVRTPLAPDLLIYWVPRGAAAPGEGAVLVGGLAGQTARGLSLPDHENAASGELIVYSVAQAEVLARFDAAEFVSRGAR